MPKGEPVFIPDVLTRRLHGSKTTPKEAVAAMDAAAGIRAQFMNDVYVAMQDPSTLDQCAIPCMASIGKLLQTHGILSHTELRNLLKGLGMTLE